MNVRVMLELGIIISFQLFLMYFLEDACYKLIVLDIVNQSLVNENKMLGQKICNFVEMRLVIN